MQEEHVRRESILRSFVSAGTFSFYAAHCTARKVFRYLQNSRSKEVFGKYREFPVPFRFLRV